MRQNIQWIRIKVCSYKFVRHIGDFGPTICRLALYNVAMGTQLGTSFVEVIHQTVGGVTYRSLL